MVNSSTERRSISGVVKLRLFLSFPKTYFLFLLQSVEILKNGTVVASVPRRFTFASRSKKDYVTEA